MAPSDNRDVRGWRAVLVIGALAAVVGSTTTGAAAAGWHVGPVEERRAALFGDSLSDEAGDAFVFAAHLAGYEAELHVGGGTAPCDWLGDLAELAARPPSQRPQVAVIEFTGNAFTPCMRPGGVMPSDSDILGAYARDGSAFVTTLLAAHVRPVFALAPAIEHESLVPQVNDLWRSLAAQEAGVAVTDAGAAVETSDRSFAATLRCASWEGPAQGCFYGRVIVRALDGAHFCPTEAFTVNGVVGPCPVPSPGAVRFAMGLARALS